MSGYDARTGKPLEGDARIVQSIGRLIVTNGDLVMRRDLACALPDLIDAPGNDVVRMLYCAAVATAIHEGESRANLRTLKVVAPDEASDLNAALLVADGQSVLVLDAVSLETGKALNFGELVS
ncbi:hypothetical protein SAMN04515647_1618 [Cohaesibacter sp. ES.047]|uniref:baseplate assembly protein n=1 Tax=Cohaesibacter sp. ES.047 TaxID=1798205 RepID=UPI000BB8388A|nr:baseplate assembly protein [Cohaesibacter sp. ES.047]SNY91396.1 hypothetical protein SAMN04515647_1618 [Cohaesibacter sp. ES.047]